MKKILLLAFVLLQVFALEAQRFFYIDSSHSTEHLLTAGLLRGAQYVTKSPLSSDYIIKADAGSRDGSGILNLKMTVQDSITSKTIFQANEEWTISAVNANTRIFLKVVISNFIDKNIGRIIVAARDDILMQA
ncbi:MAG: hypothetical protein M3N30_13315 [Bacteroidota bacterium]|nr:hypothetical protein [Bacteroidota bacterium]